MVSCPVDGEGGAAQFADDAAHVGQQGCFQFCVDVWTAIFGAKNNVGNRLVNVWAMCFRPSGAGRGIYHSFPTAGAVGYGSIAPNGAIRGLFTYSSHVWIYRSG
jgi:hypothetical protein